MSTFTYKGRKVRISSAFLLFGQYQWQIFVDGSYKYSVSASTLEEATTEAKRLIDAEEAAK